MRRFAVTLTSFLVALASLPAPAGLSQIFLTDNDTSRSAWEAAVAGPFQHEDFDDTVLLPGLSITLAAFSGEIAAGRLVDTPNGTTRTRIDFPVPVLAAGGVFDLDLDETQPVAVRVVGVPAPGDTRALILDLCDADVLAVQREVEIDLFQMLHGPMT